MLYSQPIDRKQIRFFRSMLVHVLNGDQTYKTLIDPIIKDAHALVTGAKNSYTIDRDTYHVIVRLADSDGPFFCQLDTQNLTPSDYRHVDTILAGQPQLAFV
jgi:hypothetical protein